MPFVQKLPEWNKPGTEPPASLKNAGWAATQKPPADYFNWLQYTAYMALKELQEKAQHKDDAVPIQDASITQKGVTQLSSAVTSTAEDRAATPNAVKKVNDALTAHNADNAKHITATERTAWSGKLDASQKGIPNGIATLDSNSRLVQLINASKLYYEAGDNKTLLDITKDIAIPYSTSTMAKIIEVRSNITGKIRVSFQIFVGGSTSASAEARIHINNQPKGYLRSVQYPNTTQTFTEDFDVNPNDLIQLFALKPVNNTASVKFFKIHSKGEMEVLLS